MKAKDFLLIILVVVAVFTAILMRQPSLEDWARQAPLESVPIRPGQTITGLIQARVPEGVRAQGNMTDAVSIIVDRQSRPLGKVLAGKDILLPVPYAEWHK